MLIAIAIGIFIPIINLDKIRNKFKIILQVLTLILQVLYLVHGKILFDLLIEKANGEDDVDILDALRHVQITFKSNCHKTEYDSNRSPYCKPVGNKYQPFKIPVNKVILNAIFQRLMYTWPHRSSPQIIPEFVRCAILPKESPNRTMLCLASSSGSSIELSDLMIKKSAMKKGHIFVLVERL